MKRAASLKFPLPTLCSASFKRAKQGIIIAALPLILLGFVLVSLLLAVKPVPEGMAYTKERFGKYTGTLTPGLNIIIPYIDRIGFRVDMRERKVAVNFPELKSRDNREIAASADVRMQVTDAYKAAYGTGNVDEALRLMLDQEMKTLVKTMLAEQIFNGADRLDKDLLAAIKSQEDEWGITVNFIDIHKIYPA